MEIAMADPSSSSVPLMNDSGGSPACHLTLPHVLNKERQIEKLIENSSRPSVDIEINCNNENVNVKCSPGFFNFVARPCLLGFTPGYQTKCNGITFELRSITPHCDLAGII